MPIPLLMAALGVAGAPDAGDLMPELILAGEVDHHDRCHATSG